MLAVYRGQWARPSALPAREPYAARHPTDRPQESDRHPTKNPAAPCGTAGLDNEPVDYMWAMMLSANSEHLSSVAPSIMRAKS